MFVQARCQLHILIAGSVLHKTQLLVAFWQLELGTASISFWYSYEG